MTNNQWKNLNIGDIIHGGFNNQAWTVTEIAEDDRTLNHWKEKWNPDIFRVIKLVPEGHEGGSHTWSGIPENWSC